LPNARAMPAWKAATRLLLALSLLVLPLAALPSPAPAQGIAGPYLAAEQAARRGDLEAAAEHYASVLARDTDNVELLRRAMLHQVAAGKMAQAMALARRLEQLRPGTHLARLLVSVDAARRGDFEDALGYFDDAADQENAFVGRLVEAWSAFGADDVERARMTLEGMVADGVGGPAGEFIAVYHLGLLEAANGDDAAALGHFENATEQAGTGSVRLARLRAGSLARLGRIDEARAVLEDRLAATLSDARLETLSRQLADGFRPEPLVRTGQHGLAEALFGVSQFLVRRNRLIGLSHARLATYLRDDLSEAHLLIGDELRQAEQYALAVEAYDAVAADAPEALDARIGAAEAQEAAGDLEAGLAGLRDVVTSWPTSIEAHTALGDMLRQNERFEEAAAAYDGALALVGEPEQRHWALLFQRGIAYERSDQWPLAEADFKTALELEPDQPQVLNYLGYSWVEMRMNLDEAKEMIEKAVEQRPDDGYIVDSLGWVLFRLGEFDGAVEHLERAVELRPVDPVINDHFGDALWMVGRKFEAEFQWRRALSFDPEAEEEERIRRKLRLGLDAVLDAEAAAGEPAIIGIRVDEAADGNDGG